MDLGHTCTLSIHYGLSALANELPRGPVPSIQRVARRVLELDDVLAFPSPCGLDCAFTTQFEGPYLQCNKSIISYTKDDFGGTQDCSLNAFTATSFNAFSGNRAIRGAIREDFNMSTYRTHRKIPKPGTAVNTTLIEQDFMSCVPSRASYDVTITYRGGIRSIKRSERYLGSIVEKMDYFDPNVPKPACKAEAAACANETVSKDDKAKACSAYSECQRIQAVPSSQVFLAFNDFALIDACASPLSGNYTMLTGLSFQTTGGMHITCGTSVAALDLYLMRH